jgi:3-oxoacyl-[acyl-carrier protein] reductase
MLLENEVAVVYGAGGAIGGAAARAFADEGATVLLAGRSRVKLDAVAAEIAAAGGAAEAAHVDALDEKAVRQHVDAVAEQAGGIDVSFDAIWIRGDLQGTRLIEMPREDFTLPTVTGVTTHFLTATAAARQMLKQGSGVILTPSSSSAALSGRDQRYHLTGGFSTACAAIEALSRSLAGELGPRGIRVVCLRPDAIPETWPAELADVKAHMKAGTVLGRLPRLEGVARVAAFMASDRASAMTGTVANLTCGSIMD